MLDLLTLVDLPPLTQDCLKRHFRLHPVPSDEDERADLLVRIGAQSRALVTGYGGRVTDGLLASLPALEIVACFTAGQDMVDLAAAKRGGIRVTNNSAALAPSVADLAMGLLLSVARDITGADRYVREGRWAHARYGPGRLMSARRMGLIGLGRIGTGIARRAQGFGIETAYHARREKADVPWRYFGDLSEMAQWADILMVCVPGTPETDGMVDRGILDRLGPDGWLVNVSRGSIVDQDALVEALRAGRIERAGLDVFADEPHVPKALAELPNVVLSPHQGSNTIEALQVRSEHLLLTLMEHFELSPATT